jgi:hypothetical protein
MYLLFGIEVSRVVKVGWTIGVRFLAGAGKGFFYFAPCVQRAAIA